MADTLQSSIDFASPYIGFLSLILGASNQPAIGMANIIKSIVFSPDFTYPWNRITTVSFATVVGQQDYTQTIADFGFLESATLAPASGPIFNVKDVYNSATLGESNVQSRPNAIAVLTNNLSGTIKFRFMGVPDAIYTVTLQYQSLAAPFTALSGAGGTWAPIPNYLSNLYNTGFLAKAYEYAGNEAGYAAEWQKFIAGLIAESEGLDATDIERIERQYLHTSKQPQLIGFRTQQGVAARGQQ